MLIFLIHGNILISVSYGHTSASFSRTAHNNSSIFLFLLRCITACYQRIHWINETTHLFIPLRKMGQAYTSGFSCTIIRKDIDFFPFSNDIIKFTGNNYSYYCWIALMFAVPSDRLFIYVDKTCINRGYKINQSTQLTQNRSLCTLYC